MTHERWPRSLGGLIGLGNSRYALNDLAGATQAHPADAPAFHNLAYVLFESGRYEEARTAARRAAELTDASEADDVFGDVGVTQPRL
jgi:Flp pilus assembly protein TadD